MTIVRFDERLSQLRAKRFFTPKVYRWSSRWIWRVRYKKFRGRGKNPFEKRSRADGIVQVEPTLAPKGVKVFKGLLFQAKKNLSGPNKKTKEQVRAMEEIAPGGSALFVYTSDGYRAISGATYLQHADGVTIPDLGTFLARSFLPCKTGRRGMYFDAVREILLIPIGNGDVRRFPKLIIRLLSGVGPVAQRLEQRTHNSDCSSDWF